MQFYLVQLLDQWAPEISDQELWQAMSDTYPEIVAHWDEDADERNQILALCGSILV